MAAIKKLSPDLATRNRILRVELGTPESPVRMGRSAVMR
jgi:hypothetical protein